MSANRLPHDPQAPVSEQPSLSHRIRRVLLGAPRDLHDRSLFHRISLIPFLAWVGLGADGLSSSSYGPEEAYRTLGQHTYLAVGLALMTAGTVFLIASAYSRIIEVFPHGGGGYVVATKLLGERAGVISGCALLVDYVLTIAVSIAAAWDALFSFLPVGWHEAKLPVEIGTIALLIILNVRGVRESVLALTPIFIIFLITHAVAILGGIVAHAPELPDTARAVGAGFADGVRTEGLGGLLLLFMHAYSLGGGTYTGIEAVSNGLPIMREPRVHTAKRTMLYMSTSLAATASGILICYLLWQVSYVPGKTMNAVLLERMALGIPGGMAFVILALVSEGALLFVGAQAGFIDGPRVLANMAVDSWVPRHFSTFSDRLTTQNGIVLMGVAAILILFHARGDVRQLVIMYSINVFLTFSLSMLGMLVSTVKGARQHQDWKRRALLFLCGLVLCATILVVTIFEKFSEGGWLTLLVTTGLVFLAFGIRRHYRSVGQRITRLYAEYDRPVELSEISVGPVRATEPTACILVAAYGGLGIHTVLSVVKTFPGQFKNLVFISVGVIDSGNFKGGGSLESLTRTTERALRKYVVLANSLGFPATYRSSIGMNVTEEAEYLCLSIAQEFPNVTFFAGKIIFQRERWFQRLLHNEMALSLQHRLFLAGKTMVILPARVP